jgi:hypothetical protein
MFYFHKTGVLIPRVIRELISRVSANPTFRGYKVFPNSPTHPLVRLILSLFAICMLVLVHKYTYKILIDIDFFQQL